MRLGFSTAAIRWRWRWAVGLSMHRDGHVRELAVRHLAEWGDPEEFRWLVLRCADLSTRC